jgi:hypothetical protein
MDQMKMTNLAAIDRKARALELAPDCSNTVSRVSLLTAVIASQAYLIHAIFFAHALTPISVYVIDRQTHLRLLSGQLGSLQQVFHWDGLLSTMLISVVVFVGGWMAARGTARLLGSERPAGLSGATNLSQLAHTIAPNNLATASTGGIV